MRTNITVNVLDMDNIIKEDSAIVNEVHGLVQGMQARFSNLSYEKILGGSIQWLPDGEITPKAIRDAVFKYYIELVN